MNVEAVLVSRVVPGWPETLISESVPLGKCYRVETDSVRRATLYNAAHPEWGEQHILAILDIDDGHPLPLCCLRAVKIARPPTEGE
jgi:hypothetical protein